MTIAALCSTVILGVLAVLQLALAFGAPLGRFAWGGQYDVLPRSLRTGSLVSIVIYALIALLQLDKADVIDVVPDLFSDVATWFFFAYFVMGIVLNAISRSKPERFTMTPVVTVLAILALIVALG